VDTHAHLQWARFDKDREKVISRAKKVGVEYIVNIGFDIGGSRKAVELAQKHKGLYATVGIHPHNAGQIDQDVLNKIRQLSEKPKVVAVGEIGLDYYRNLSPKEAQKKAFILSKHNGKTRGIMHCFSGSREMAEQCVELGFYISFAGPVTFPNSNRLHEIAKWVDLNRVLLETDSPWLAPQEMRGKRNEPAFLPFVAKKIARLREISLDELAEATTENVKEIFQFRFL